jgi:hypothetical protein
MAEEYHEVDVDAFRDERDALRSIRRMSLASCEMSDVTVRRVAKYVATITYQGTLHGTFDAKPMTPAPFLR